ncbi:MAG: 30S ribosomal protein S3 [Candidatus Kerfeldbacteria bacterium]|nr:30S ribosomal protein S3 [Candidatus Kerfeldbacteria bacterium]
MGQKVHPKIFRIGVNKTWSSKWFAKGNFGDYLREDERIRKFIRKKYRTGGVALISIARAANTLTVTINTSRPGVIIGRGGTGAEELKKELKTLAANPKINLRVDIEEVDRPDLNAELIMQSVIEQLEKRLPFRRILKQTVERVKRSGAKGVKIMVSGRLNGAEIARTEALHTGSIPLHTLRADIDYSRGAARTTYGAIGVKVWVYKGEIFEQKKA